MGALNYSKPDMNYETMLATLLEGFCPEGPSSLPALAPDQR